MTTWLPKKEEELKLLLVLRGSRKISPLALI